jgi:hypothetical protein
MTLSRHREDLENYHLLLVLPKQRQVLLSRTESAYELPGIEIPRFTRAAEQITSAVMDRWHLPSLVIDWISGGDGTLTCAILEVRRTIESELLPTDLIAASIDDLAEGIVPQEAFIALQRMLSGDTGARGPFSRFQWIDDAEQWMRNSVGDASLEFTKLRQLNASGSFALVRFEAQPSNRAYWLKAVGDPNTREFAATAYLASNYAQYLPNMVAQRADWNAWVMDEYGSSLHSSCSLADFERAVTKLARLQKGVVGRTQELLDAQCVDHRLEILRPQIDGLIEFLDEAMNQQESTKVQPLSKLRLREIGAMLHVACNRMEELGIPDSLMHGDISPGSILSNGHDCVFTDWCEAYVGNPFITFEQFCIHAERKTHDPQEWNRRLRDAYKTCWIDILTRVQIDNAVQLARVISLLSHLYGRGDWLHSPRRLDPALQGYARSLARHMDRLVGDPDLLEVLCQPS